MKPNFALIVAIFLIVGTMDYHDQGVMHVSEAQFAADYIDFINAESIVPCDDDTDCMLKNPHIGE